MDDATQPVDDATQPVDGATQPVDDANPALDDTGQTPDGRPLIDDVFDRFIDNISTNYIPDPQVTLPFGSCIPQRRYCEGVVIPTGTGARSICFAMADSQSFPADLALIGNCHSLVDRDGAVFTGDVKTISLRIDWPGYNGWTGQIRVVNYQAQPMSITRARLVTEIAKQLEKFIDQMQFVAIDPADEWYQVGPGRIELPHISIASLEQVSKGSWQPRFICNGP